MIAKTTDHFSGESKAKVMVMEVEVSASAPNSKAKAMSDVSVTNDDVHILPALAQADVTPASAATTSTAVTNVGLDLLLAASQSRSAAVESVPSVTNARKGFRSVKSKVKVVKADAELTTSVAAYNSNHFPWLLHEILVTPEYQPIVHWLADGLSFIIADKKRLESEILPKYFRRALSTSFVRKLNRWGFRRIKSRNKGEDSSFAHEKFVRDSPLLCLKMKCRSMPNPDSKVCSTLTSATSKRNNNKRNSQHSYPLTAETANSNGHFKASSSMVSAQANPIHRLLAAHASERAMVGTSSVQAHSSVGPLRFVTPHPRRMLPAMGSPSGIAPPGIQESHFVASNRYNEGERQRLVANLLHLHRRRQCQLQADLQHLRMTVQIRQQLANNIRFGGQSTTSQLAQYPLRGHDILRSERSSAAMVRNTLQR